MHGSACALVTALGVLVLACSSNGDAQPALGSAGAGGSGAAAGGSGNGAAGGPQVFNGVGAPSSYTCTPVQTKCYDTCAHTASLKCPNYVSHVECEGLCNAALTQEPSCVTLWEAKLDCELAMPRTACGGTDPDPCSAAFQAWDNCRAQMPPASSPMNAWEPGTCGPPVEALPPAGVTKHCTCITPGTTVRVAAGCDNTLISSGCGAWKEWFCRNVNKTTCDSFSDELEFTSGQQLKADKCLLELDCP